MSGSTYSIHCKTCNQEGIFEISDDGWTGIRMDDSNAECHDCKIKRYPEKWFDHQCSQCSKWFNTPRYGEPGGVGLSTALDPLALPSDSVQIWVCNDCMKTARVVFGPREGE